jgi:hypothetical protein
MLPKKKIFFSFSNFLPQVGLETRRSFQAAVEPRSELSLGSRPHLPPRRERHSKSEISKKRQIMSTQKTDNVVAQKTPFFG